MGVLSLARLRPHLMVLIRFLVYLALLLHAFFLVEKFVVVFVRQVSQHAVTVDTLWESFIRTALFMMIDIMLLFGLIIKKRVAYLLTLAYGVSLCVLYVVRHQWYQTSLCASVVILLFSARRYFAFSYSVRTYTQKIFYAISVLIPLFLLHIFFIAALSSQMKGSISLGTDIQDFFYQMTGVGSDVLVPISLLAKVYVGVSTFLFCVAIVYLFFYFFDDRGRIPQGVHLYDTEQLLHSDDSLAVFKLDSSLSTFEWEGHRIYYKVQGSVFLALGNPEMSMPDREQAMIGQFISHAHKHGAIVSWVQIHPRFLPFARSEHMIALYSGAEAVLDMDKFDLASPAYKDIRYAVKKIAKDGIDITIKHFHEVTDDEMEEMHFLIRQWFRAKGTYGTAFTMSHFPIDRMHVPGRVLFARDKEGTLLGILTFLPYHIPDVSYSMDFIVKAEKVPSAFNDGMVGHILQYFKTEGVKKVSLSLTPVVDPHAPHLSLSKKIQRLYFTIHLKYQFWGLYNFKQKFHPEWEPRYLLIEDIEHMPQVFLALQSSIFKKSL